MGGVKTNWHEHVAHRKLGQKPHAHTKQKHKHMASKQITSHVQNRAGRGAGAVPAGRGAWAAQGRPPGQQRALERPPGLEGWKKPSSSSFSSVSESGMPQPRRPPLVALELHRSQLWALQLLWPPLERALERIAWAPGTERALPPQELCEWTPPPRKNCERKPPPQELCEWAPPPREHCERSPPPWVDRERPPLASPTSTEYPPRCVSARDAQRMKPRICKWPARSEEVLEQQPKLGGGHPPAVPPPSNRWHGPPSPNRTMYLAHPALPSWQGCPGLLETGGWGCSLQSLAPGLHRRGLRRTAQRGDCLGGRDAAHWLRSGSSVVRELGIKRFPSLLSLQVVGSFCQGWGEWMRRGLKCRLWATYLIKIKQTNKQTKTTP